MKYIVAMFIIILIVLQFFQPEKTNPATDSSLSLEEQTEISPHIAKLIGRACRDCHTNDTVWPLHSYIAPISWLVDYDVRRGREHVNFSVWGNYEPPMAWVLLDATCEQIMLGKMPPKRYLVVHPEAKLADTEKEAICGWAMEEKKNYE